MTAEQRLYKEIAERDAWNARRTLWREKEKEPGSTVYKFVAALRSRP